MLNMVRERVPQNVLEQLVALLRKRNGRATLDELKAARVCASSVLVPAMRELIARRLVALQGDADYSLIEGLPIAIAAREARQPSSQQPPATGLKRCATCHDDKPRGHFSPHGRAADGLCATCNECREKAKRASERAGVQVLNIPTVRGVHVAVSADTVVISSDDERPLHLSRERGLAVARFILTACGAE